MIISYVEKRFHETMIFPPVQCMTLHTNVGRLTLPTCSYYVSDARNIILNLTNDDECDILSAGTAPHHRS